MAKVKAYIHGGDYDCSELIRMVFVAVGVLAKGCYMWTGNQLDLMLSNGFKKRSLQRPQIGDVLWRSGHTELYLGDGLQGGARMSETGGITGRQGDQTGYEVASSAYNPDEWTYLLRYEGGKCFGGIPCAIAAALLAKHIIEHAAHGYSQPNRAGDGTVEAVTLTWYGNATETSCQWQYDRNVRVRTSPSTKGDILDSKWKEGDVAKADGIVVAEGITWITYIGPTTGLRLYSAITEKGVEYGQMVA